MVAAQMSRLACEPQLIELSCKILKGNGGVKEGEEAFFVYDLFEKGDITAHHSSSNDVTSL